MPHDIGDAQVSFFAGPLAQVWTVAANAATSQGTPQLGEGVFSLSSNAHCYVNLGALGATVAASNGLRLPANTVLPVAIGPQDPTSIVMLSESGTAGLWVAKR